MLPKTPTFADPPARNRSENGALAEDRALEYLQNRGLQLLQRNFATPGRGGGEIDLVMQDLDGTLVFVEVRQRSREDHGGAGASITATKKRRIVFAARHYLLHLSRLPPCRFDVVLLDGPRAEPVWLIAAFDASGF
jgi:putative endonuclease